MSDMIRAWHKAVNRAYDDSYRAATVGKHNPDAPTTYTVAGRADYLWVTFADQTTTAARNDAGVPQVEDLEVWVRKEYNPGGGPATWVIEGRSAAGGLSVPTPTPPDGVLAHLLGSHTDVDIAAGAEGDVLAHDGTDWVDEAPITTSAGAGDAGKLIRLDGSGMIDTSMYVGGFTQEEIEDFAAAMLTGNSGRVQFSYDDGAGTLTAILDASAADKYLYSTGADTWAEGDITAFARSLLDDAAASNARTTLGITAYDQETVEDFVGAMVSGNTETGIAVTYDDGAGKLNFDAQTAGDARYAPIAKGVTNGDSHDHSGGDGAQIAYSSLSGLPTVYTQEEIEDFIAAMLTGGTQTGITVSYDDANGEIDFVLPTYIRADGTVELSADWDIGENQTILAEYLQARDGEGLTLIDQSGNEVVTVISDALGIGTDSPTSGSKVDIQHSATDTGDHRSLNIQNTFTPGSNSSSVSRGMFIQTNHAGSNDLTSSNLGGGLIGLSMQARHTGTGTVTRASGFEGLVQVTAAGTATHMFGAFTQVRASNASATITNGYGFYMEEALRIGTIIDLYGVYIDDATAKNYLAGSLGVGVNSYGASKIGVQAGGSSNDAAVGGLLYETRTQTGNVGTGEDVLASYVLPANTLSANGMKVRISAWGTYSGSNNVRLRLRFGTGGTNLVMDDIAYAGGNGTFFIEAYVKRIGSTTQRGVTKFTWGSTLNVQSNLALNQTLSGAITIQLTAEGTSNDDAVVQSFEVDWHDANT